MSLSTILISQSGSIPFSQNLQVADTLQQHKLTLYLHRSPICRSSARG